MDESPNPDENEELGRGWVEYRRPDKKKGCRGPSQEDGWRCSNVQLT
jgi:hypothetical protein